MKVLSYTHYLCLVIIVFSDFVSLQTSKTIAECSSEEKLIDDKNPSPQDHSPATFDWQSGVVPFVIGEEYDEIISQRIHAAMRTIEGSSCVVFKDMKEKPTKGQHSFFTWLSIENPLGVRDCSHTTMREEGVQAVTKAILTIGYDCMTRRDILHALLHALGFRDEVTHPQRDMYVRVMWSNIQPKYRSLFWMRMGDAPHKMVEYDSLSIMHFHDRAFSMNGGPSIMPLVSGLLISPSDTLSQIDVMKLRLAFGHECNKRRVGHLLQTCQNALKDDDEEQANLSKPAEHVQPTDPKDVSGNPAETNEDQGRED